MRKTKIRRRSKSSIGKIQRQIWELCKKIIRARYPHECYTCGAENLKGSNLHTGHMIPKGALGPYLRYDLRLLRNQCARCNKWGGGMGAQFLMNMVKREGQDYVDEILADRTVIVRAYDHYEQVLDQYKQLAADL